MTLTEYLDATSKRRSPGQDRLIALLSETPGLDRAAITRELRLTYTAVVDLCARAERAGWVVSAWHAGRAGRRSTLRYRLADAVPGSKSTPPPPGIPRALASSDARAPVGKNE